MKLYHYLLSIVLILTGLVFLVYSEIEVEFICIVAACAFAVAGIASVISYFVREAAESFYRLDLVHGIMALFLAVVFVTKREEIAEYFSIMIGCILVANGVVKLQHAVDMKRIDRKMRKVTETWLIVVIFSLLVIAAGTIAIYAPPSEERTLFVYFGIAFVVAGITDIFTQFVFNRKVRSFHKAAEEALEEKMDSQTAAHQAADPQPEEASDKVETIPEEIVSDAVDPEA
ncbi:MAG: DUF308 domain-containing protein [Lachnospiraceae bacterium]|nr:DUF308 domain-containing protein [Lachnospiraceae bacterium]